MTSHSQIYRARTARAALDLTVGAPKITLQALISGDERLIQANDNAMATALPTKMPWRPHLR